MVRRAPGRRRTRTRGAHGATTGPSRSLVFDRSSVEGSNDPGTSPRVQIAELRLRGGSVNITRNAPATAEGELQIAADPDTVWQVLADLEGWPTWNPGIRSVALDGPLAPGSVFRWRAGTSLTSTLQVVDRPR